MALDFDGQALAPISTADAEPSVRDTGKRVCKEVKIANVLVGLRDSGGGALGIKLNDGSMETEVTVAELRKEAFRLFSDRVPASVWNCFRGSCVAGALAATRFGSTRFHDALVGMHEHSVQFRQQIVDADERSSETRSRGIGASSVRQCLLWAGENQRKNTLEIALG